MSPLQQLLEVPGYQHPHPYVQRVLRQLKHCRTPANGYHLYACSRQDCQYFRYQYHSCRNRHCPLCGALKKDEWIEARRNELLPVKYYHVVFTLPHELNSMIMGNQRLLYNLLFDAAAHTLMRFGADPRYLGATPAIIAVLHTWGQQLSYHPHLHCIVSAGGITQTNKEKQWVQATGNDWRFLFPVKAMNIVYRARFLCRLRLLIRQAAITPPPGQDAEALIQALFKKDWVVFAKAPFAGPMQVIEYLGRYTHKVAISNHRILQVSVAEQTVTFAYKDYADKGTQKQMTLHASEFLRRFAQHILPRHFTKIRTYGYLANRGRHTRLRQVVQQLQLPPHPPPVKIPREVRLLEKTHTHHNSCPDCGHRSVILKTVQLPLRAPPTSKSKQNA